MKTLHLVTPHQHGPQVKALQTGIDNVAKEKKDLDLPRVKHDAELGPHTLHAAAKSAFALGLSPEDVQAVRHGKISENVQRVILDPSKRGDKAHERAKQRHDDLIKHAQAQHTGASAAAKWMLAQVGTHEEPPGSNLGPGITDWERETGYAVPPGVFWCGCAVHHAVCVVGKANIPVGSRLGYDGNINNDARAHTNGLELVSSVNSRLGDIVTFSFHHIALLTAPVDSAGVHSVDGNSSASDGTNNNGGEVATHTRSLSLVTVIARPAY